MPPRKNTFGGQFVSVDFLDGRPGDQIFVKLLPPRHYPDLRRALEDEPRQAEIFTGRDAAFIDSLRPESVEAIVLTGWDLNRAHVNRNASRVLEQTGEEAARVLEMIENFPADVKELPGVVDRYRGVAAMIAEKGFPSTRSHPSAFGQIEEKNQSAASVPNVLPQPKPK